VRSRRSITKSPDRRLKPSSTRFTKRSKKASRSLMSHPSIVPSGAEGEDQGNPGTCPPGTDRLRDGRIDVSLVDPINDSSRSEKSAAGMVVALQLDPGFHFPDVMPRT